ncbi:MAG: hypothetical protein HLUCCA04_04025 [Oceanicaulis sp. HLUCCA04]|nr:MAG: hypothetical protein HLUCCA04_04025 [Oceanicaulis sp. HLUCCA04]
MSGGLPSPDDLWMPACAGMTRDNVLSACSCPDVGSALMQRQTWRLLTLSGLPTSWLPSTLL